MTNHWKVMLLPPSRRAQDLRLYEKLYERLAATGPQRLFSSHPGREGEIVFLLEDEARSLMMDGFAARIYDQQAELDSPTECGLTSHVEQRIECDPILKSLQAICKRFNVFREIARRFSPANFVSGLVERSAASTCKVDCYFEEQHERLLDHLWAKPNATRLPLALQMAELEQDDQPASPGDDDDNFTFLDDRKLVVHRRWALRRDELFASFATALGTGKIRARGFQAGDVKRQFVDILPEWWTDPKMICDWKDGELLPGEGAPEDTPHYRGIRLNFGEADCFETASIVRPGPKSKRNEMQAARKALKQEGYSFRSLKDEYAAVMQRVQPKKGVRGYDIQTFRKLGPI